jgi:hypothetical protein
MVIMEGHPRRIRGGLTVPKIPDNGVWLVGLLVRLLDDGSLKAILCAMSSGSTCRCGKSSILKDLHYVELCYHDTIDAV